MSTGDSTRKLPAPFLVLATQNPIEQEGTYPLPEAQLDRFLLKVSVPYAVRHELMEILDRTTAMKSTQAEPVLDAEDIVAARELSRRVLIAPTVQDYAIRLVMSTHPEGEFEIPAFRHYIQVGASPRAAQALVSTARVLAIMDGRYAASIEDVRRVALPVLRHRIIRTFEAEADGVDPDQIIEGLLDRVPVDPDHPEDLALTKTEAGS